MVLGRCFGSMGLGTKVSGWMGCSMGRVSLDLCRVDHDAGSGVQAWVVRK